MLLQKYLTILTTLTYKNTLPGTHTHYFIKQSYKHTVLWMEEGHTHTLVHSYLCSTLTKQSSVATVTHSKQHMVTHSKTQLAMVTCCHKWGYIMRDCRAWARSGTNDCFNGFDLPSGRRGKCFFFFFIFMTWQLMTQSNRTQLGLIKHISQQVSSSGYSPDMKTKASFIHSLLSDFISLMFINTQTISIMCDVRILQLKAALQTLPTTVRFWTWRLRVNQYFKVLSEPFLMAIKHVFLLSFQEQIIYGPVVLMIHSEKLKKITGLNPSDESSAKWTSSE